MKYRTKIMDRSWYVGLWICTVLVLVAAVIEVLCFFAVPGDGRYVFLGFEAWAVYLATRAILALREEGWWV